MCRIAVADGIRVIVATPHTLNGQYDNDRKTIMEAVQRLQDALKRQEVGITILPGSEIRVDPSVPALLKKGRLMTLNNLGKAVILEFPPHFVPENMLPLIKTLVKSEILPVICHPERTPQFSDPGVLREMLKAGAVSQVTAMSLLGDAGSDVQKLTRYFLKENLVQAVATDAHDPVFRTPKLTDAFYEVSRILNTQKAKALTLYNPLSILKGLRPHHSYM